MKVLKMKKFISVLFLNSPYIAICNIFNVTFQGKTFLLSCAFMSFCNKLCPLLRTGDIKW